MTDRGARELAERLHAAIGDQKIAYYVRDLNRSLLADAILANGAVFLPNAAELERLRRIEAAARAFITVDDKDMRLVLERERELAAAINPEPEGSAQG